MFLTVCLNPVLQKTIIVDSFEEGLVNRSAEYYFDAAGKGIHVSRVLAQLSEEVTHITQLGGIYKPSFLYMVKAERFTFLPVDSEAEIRFCYTILDNKKHITTEIVEQGEVVCARTERSVLTRFHNNLKKNDWLIISGSKAPGFSDELYPEMVRTAKARGKTVLLDLRGDDLLEAVKYRPDFIKLNMREFCATFIPAVDPQRRKYGSVFSEQVRAKMLQLFRQFGVHTVITNQEQPIIFHRGNRPESFEPRQITPVNTTGCGDAFTAGFASEYEKTRDIVRAVRRGEECARKNALLVRPGRIKPMEE